MTIPSTDPATDLARTPGIGPDIAPALLSRYRAIRGLSRSLTRDLSPEDFVVQSMTDVSPLKWHLAHTTWFFEAFVLAEHLSGYRPLDERYHYLFNSYYVHAGERHCRAQRGYLSRPTVQEVLAYRTYVDEAMEGWLASVPEDARALELLELGLNHEQQHQELMLTDLKHIFSVNPLRPAYRPDVARPGRRAMGSPGDPAPLTWSEFPEGVREIGWGSPGFSYDNERPRHRTFLEPFALANRLVRCGEYLDFMTDGGYERPELWMSDGWAVAQERRWSEPFYWERRDGEWWIFTLSGMQPLDRSEPVCHLSWYEADAFARWAGARLPTEAEWEAAAEDRRIEGNLLDSEAFHPVPQAETARAGDLDQLFGDVWEWTGSAYRPYPGFRIEPGAVGEYNGKFMSNQIVLRGGSCVTPADHLRATYRNFFHPDACWQFSGIRLARDLERREDGGHP